MYEILFYNLDLFFFTQAILYSFSIVFCYQIYNRTKDRSFIFSCVALAILIINIFYAGVGRLADFDYEYSVRLFFFIIILIDSFFIIFKGKHLYIFRAIILLILAGSDLTSDWLYREIFAAILAFPLFIIYFNDLKKIKNSYEIEKLKKLFFFFLLLLLLSFWVIFKIGEKDFNKFYLRSQKNLFEIKTRIEDEIVNCHTLLKLFPGTKIVEYLKDPIENESFKDHIYERFQELIAFNPGSILYIMDKNGTVLLSSNHDSQESFEEKNFNFRPYFLEALHGKDYSYLAIGKVTGVRGLYISSPILDKKNNNSIVGVIVIKRPMEVFDEMLEDYVYIVSSDDLIFASSNSDDLLRFLTPKDIDVINKLRDNMLFALSDRPEPVLASEQISEGKIVIDKREGNWENLLPVSFDLPVKGFRIIKLQKFEGLHERRILIDMFLFFCFFFLFTVINHYENIKNIMRRLRISERNLSETLDLMSVLVFEADEELNLTYYNKAFREFFNIKDKVNNFKDFIHKDSVPEILFIFAKMKNSAISDFEFNIKTKDGKVRAVLMSSSNFRRKSSMFFRGVLYDITGKKELLEKIETTDNKYSYTLSSLPFPLIEIDERNNITLVNDSFKEEFSFDDSLPCPVESILNERSENNMMISVKKVFKGERVDNIEISLNHGKRGKYFLGSGIPVYENGHLTKGRFVFNNITSLIRYEKEIRDLLIAVDRSLVGISIYTNDLITIYCNPMFEEITGYSKNEIIGNSSEKVGIGTIKRDSEWEGEITLKDRTGRERFLYQKIAPVYSDKNYVTGYVSIIIDISDRKKLEKDLMKSKKEAERLSETRKLLMMKMSHEINTPLNKIINVAQISRDRSDNKLLSAELDQIIKESEVLNKVIKNILLLSEIEMNGYKPYYKSTNVLTVIEDVISHQKEMIKEKNIEIRVSKKKDIDKELLVDRNVLEIVVHNLVSNAIKYTEEGSVDIDVKIDEERMDLLLLTVKDTGAGIDKNRQALIFEPFFQEQDSLKRHFQGLGLGLSITKKVLNSIGGDIFLESSKVLVRYLGREYLLKKEKT